MSIEPPLINPFFRIDIEQELSTSRSNTHWYATAVKVTEVAFYALALSAILYSAFCAPQTLVLATLVTLTFKFWIQGSFISPLEEREASSHTKWVKYQELNDRIQDLSTRGEEAFLEELRALELNPSDDLPLQGLRQLNPSEPLRAFTPIVARYRYWEALATSSHEESQKQVKLARKIHVLLTHPETEVSEALAETLNLPSRVQFGGDLSHEERHLALAYKRELQLKAYQAEEGTELPAKIMAAYFLHVARHPVDTRLVREFGAKRTLPYPFRALSREFDGEDPYFKMSRGEDLSRARILELSIHELSSTIFT